MLTARVRFEQGEPSANIHTFGDANYWSARPDLTQSLEYGIGAGRKLIHETGQVAKLPIDDLSYLTGDR